MQVRGRCFKLNWESDARTAQRSDHQGTCRPTCLRHRCRVARYLRQHGELWCGTAVNRIFPDAAGFSRTRIGYPAAVQAAYAADDLYFS